MIQTKDPENMTSAWRQWHACGVTPDTTKGRPGRNPLLNRPFSPCPRQDSNLRNPLQESDRLVARRAETGLGGRSWVRSWPLRRAVVRCR
ncbi:hypothetical protein GCM10019016_069860 [Streptomyces prasinosporus]|uniref:Uncharacterized protein n=1 Tax=Streptomyces prasinosporus TaxID=68256 RepID=A0ABP6TWZ3_9ACTN